MKLGYNTKAKDPTYYIQVGIRNEKKQQQKILQQSENIPNFLPLLMIHLPMRKPKLQNSMQQQRKTIK